MSREIELEKKVNRVLQEAIDTGELPCANVMVLHKDKVVCYTQAGKDPGTGEEISRDTIFRLYSQSKPITSAAVCLLMERGIIDMNDPVEKYLPGFAGSKVLGKDGELIPAQRPVKLMDLMGMSAGLCYPMEDAPGQYAAKLFDANQQAMDEGKPGYTTVEFANEIGKLPLAFQPGSDFRYSTCADVLGAVVEVASGKSYSEFLREEIFAPLEMEDTGFSLPEEKLPRLVTCAKRTPEGIQVMECKHLNVGNYTREPAFASGGAGLVSTLDDYRHFAAMLLQGGEYKGQRILSEETVRWMTSSQVDLKWRWGGLEGYGYGKLMRVCDVPGEVPGLAMKGEYGWDGWLGTYFANFPQEKLTLLLNQNVADTGTGPVTRKVRNVVLAHLC
ncbi:MAG: beta-lactamase family protein [Clostridia bacterium]|nr:beta-lactamase family protein [Clostridia bacterium]